MLTNKYEEPRIRSHSLRGLLGITLAKGAARQLIHFPVDEGR